MRDCSANCKKVEQQVVLAVIIHYCLCSAFQLHAGPLVKLNGTSFKSTVTAIAKDPQLSWDGGTPMPSSGQCTYPLPTHDMHLRTTKVHGAVHFGRWYKLHTNLVVLTLTNGWKCSTCMVTKPKLSTPPPRPQLLQLLSSPISPTLLIQPPPAKTKHMTLALWKGQESRSYCASSKCEYEQ